MFARNWSPDTGVATLLGAVYSLLLDPEPKDPLDSRLAELFLTNRPAYTREVEDHTRRHAAATAYEVAKRTVMGETGYWRAARETAVGETSRRGLVCPLTRQLFRDPVTTPDGVTYERSAITSHLAECRATGLPLHDPTLSALGEGLVHPLGEADLVTDEVVAREAAQYAAGVDEVRCLPSYTKTHVCTRTPLQHLSSTHFCNPLQLIYLTCAALNPSPLALKHLLKISVPKIRLPLFPGSAYE